MSPETTASQYNGEKEGQRGEEAGVRVDYGLVSSTPLYQSTGGEG